MIVFCHCVDQYQRVPIYEIFLLFSERLIFPFEISSSWFLSRDSICLEN